MSETKNIYQRINAVMEEVVYIKRGSAGHGTGVLYDEVIAGLKPLLVKNGIVVTVDFIADSSRSNAKGNYIYEGYFDVKYINMDDPKDRITSKIVAHSMDAGDKAPGKAITYACKISHLKVFGFETGENDESRTAGDDCSAALDSINTAPDIKLLQDVFTEAYRTYPASRVELCEAKDNRKRELANA